MAALSAAIIAATMLVAAGTTATVSNMNAIKARQDAKGMQRDNLAAAKAAADKSKGATTSNAGDISLESTSELEDAAIRGKSTKNRLRVGTTGLSIGAPSKSSTGLSV